MTYKENNFLLTKIAGSGSVSITQRYGSVDLHPDPYQNFMDPQNWLELYKFTLP